MRSVHLFEIPGFCGGGGRTGRRLPRMGRSLPTPAWARAATGALAAALLAGCALTSAEERAVSDQPLARTPAATSLSGAEPQPGNAINEVELEALANIAPAAGVGSPEASPAGAAQFVKRLGESAIATMADPSLDAEERARALRGLLVRGFDLDNIGRIVLGRYWPRATPAQRAEYRRLFRDFIVAIYSARFSRYSGEALAVTGARPAKRGIVVVNSLIRRPHKAPVQVDWLVRYSAAGYRVIDVIVEGVSMAITQRSEFASIIQSRGGDVETLLAALRARTT